MAEYNAAPHTRHPLGAGARSAQRVDAASEVAAAAPGEAGLQNETGDYNCFLNVVVQCLWHCAAFKDALLRLPASALQVQTLSTKAVLSV